MVEVINITTGVVPRWGRGQLPPNLGFVSKYDMKHCLTNSKHQHIGAKRSVLWSLKYAKIRFCRLHPNHDAGAHNGGVP